MKLKVNRKLTNGNYLVDFTATDFTPSEISKMESFGIPTVDVYHIGPSGGRVASRVPITKLAPQYRASFSKQEDATAYEERIVGQIRDAMKTLRERKDDFSSDSEVDV
jgi:hypothetical protein